MEKENKQNCPNCGGELVEIEDKILVNDYPDYINSEMDKLKCLKCHYEFKSEDL